MASGLEQAKSQKFFEKQLKEYEERRAVLCEAFDRLGLKYSLPEGTYFVLLVTASRINFFDIGLIACRMFPRSESQRIIHSRILFWVEGEIFSEFQISLRSACLFSPVF